MRVLDLGCGSGKELASWGVAASDEVTGLDLDGSRLALAKVRFPNRTYLQGVGERLAFADGIFDRVISRVALPYMNIQKALAEVHRVLVPGGGLRLSLHLPSFAIAELLHKALPKPVPTLFRLYVMANGVWFHCTGKTVGFVRRRTESFQTARGIEDCIGSRWIRQSCIQPGNRSGGRDFHCGSDKVESLGRSPT